MINSIRHLRCPMCPYATSRYHDLKRHMQVHNKHTEIIAIDETVCMHCNKKFSHKYNCARHMVTCAAKHMIGASNPMIDASNPMISTKIVYKDEFPCPTCYKSYTRSAYLDAHWPKCKQIQHPLECDKCHHIFSTDGNLSIHRKTCKGISKALVIPQSHMLKTDMNDHNPTINIININNTQNNTLTNNHINVNSFGQESKNHIDQGFIDKCLRGMMGDGVPNMVKRLHLDPNAPENHNVQIYSKKHSLMKIKEDNEWNIKDRNDVLDKVIHNSLALLYNNFHNPDSTVKKEDQEQHFNAIAMRMLEISNKLPKVHFPLRRKVFALVMNFCDQLTDITKDL